MGNESPLAGMTGLEPVMRESKSLALPLGYTPIGNPAFFVQPGCGADGRIRTHGGLHPV